MTVQATRLLDTPAIYPDMDERMGRNINGPSLIRCPDWIRNPLGKYYLYFANHRGTYIRLAYADNLSGPWNIYSPGVLDLAQSGFPNEQEIPQCVPGVKDEDVYAHIASPDVLVLRGEQKIRLYYHGFPLDGGQTTRFVDSGDGLNFGLPSREIGPAYLRVYPYAGKWYALAMPGILMCSNDGKMPFEKIGEILPARTRHSAALVKGNNLYIAWTEVGDKPERIYFGTLDLSAPAESRELTEKKELLRPELSWEGSETECLASEYGAVDVTVNQLRDPCLFADGADGDEDDIYLLYAGGGEAGIGISRLIV